jgi:hypothetical protein
MRKNNRASLEWKTIFNKNLKILLKELRNMLFRFILKITKHVKLAVSRNTKFQETASLFRETMKLVSHRVLQNKKQNEFCYKPYGQSSPGPHSPGLLSCSFPDPFLFSLLMYFLCSHYKSYLSTSLQSSVVNLVEYLPASYTWTNIILFCN